MTEVASAVETSGAPPVPGGSHPSTAAHVLEMTVPPSPAFVTTPADAPVATVEMPPLGPVAPRPVPSLTDVPRRPTWNGESDRRAEAGPMFPDLFQQAVAGSVLANAITVNFADGERRESLDVAASSGPTGDIDELVSASWRVPAEVGAFMGASAKKRRWRH
jgi:hypothetical protein